MNKTALDALMRPQSVAIVGASSDPTKIGYTVVNNIIEGGYQGKIYPVNPKASEILGHKAYPTLQDIPGPVDAAVITVPAKFVLPVVEDAGKKGDRKSVV